MADLKISQLPAASTSSGPDLYPIVQAGGNFSITFALLQSALAAATVPGQLPTITLTGGVTGSGSGGSIATTIPASSIANSMLANMPAGTLKGNITGSSAGPSDLTFAQVTSALGLFSSSLQGLVPASGGGSVNFLRADGTWSPPSGGGSTASTIANVFSAGESFSANTSYVVRWGMNALSETTDMIYAADYITSSYDEFWAIGIAFSSTAVSSSDPITVYSLGAYTLGSGDTPFSTSDVGKPVWLTMAGSFSTTAPSGDSEADLKVGIVMSPSQMWINDQMMGVGSSPPAGGGSDTAAEITYTPGDSTKWAGTPPSTVQQALDRLAAVVGASIPIP